MELYRKIFEFFVDSSFFINPLSNILLILLLYCDNIKDWSIPSVSDNLLECDVRRYPSERHNEVTDDDLLFKITLERNITFPSIEKTGRKPCSVREHIEGVVMVSECDFDNVTCV